tara:strand:+ start:916 stop:4275 length:3360 start_codon:yes stop_codon:yes gene_type:complete
MAKEVTKEELQKIRPSVINEQAILMLNLSKIMDDIILFPPTRMGYDYFSCLLDKEPAFLQNHLFGSDFSSLLNLRPYELSIFTPRLRFYKKLLYNEEFVELSFDANIDGTLGSDLKRYNPIDILNQEASRGSGVGILGFDWKLSGDITDTPEKRLQMYSADLRLRVERVADLFVVRNDSRGNIYELSHLFAPERGSNETVDEEAYELLVEVGWNVLKDQARGNKIYDTLTEETLEAIERTKLLFRLALKDHSIDFNQDGSLTVTLNYIASLAAKSGSPIKSNLIRGEYRKQIESQVVFEAMAKAMETELEKTEDNTIAQKKLDALEYKKLVQNLGDNYSDLKRFSDVNSMSLAEALPAYAKRNRDAENQINRETLGKISQIYAKFAREHQEEIDKRILEYQEFVNVKWMMKNLLNSNRIKVFQVKKENVLMTDKIISTTKTKTMAKILGTDADTVQKAFQSELESSEGIDTISEQLANANLELVRDETNALREVILVRNKTFILDPTTGVEKEQALTVKKVYPREAGAQAVYRVEVFAPDSEVQVNTRDFPVRKFISQEITEFIARYSNGEDFNDINIEGTEGYIAGKTAESDAVFRIPVGLTERLETLEKIDAAAQGESEKVPGINTASDTGSVVKTRSTATVEENDYFLKDLARRIAKGREVEKGGEYFLNIRYITVGDIFDALLERAYDQNKDFKDKFILGPIVVNEAEALIGDPQGFSIKYPESDTEELSVVIKKGTDGKKSKITKKRLAERTDRIYNLADIPVSVDSLLLWLQKNVSENRTSVMTFDRFLSGLLKTLLSDCYSIKSQARMLLPNVNFSFEMDSFTLLQKKSNGKSRTEVDIFGMSAHHPYRKRSKERPRRQARLATTSDLSAALKLARPANVSHDTFENKAKLVDYHLITAKCKFPDKREYDYLEDMRDGIPHFFIGQDSGLVKNIEFSQTDIPGLIEKNVENAQKGAREGSSPAGIYLKKPYNATVTLVGNPFFSRGQMVFINPSMAGAGSLRNGYSHSARLGLGGYYRVTEIANSIDASGKYETQLECVWQSYGTAAASTNDKMTEPKAQEIHDDYNVNLNAMEMVSDHLFYVENGVNTTPATMDPSSYINYDAAKKFQGDE